MQPASQSIEGGKKRRSRRGKRSSSKTFGVRSSGDFVPALVQPGELEQTLILGFWVTFNLNIGALPAGIPELKVTRPLVDAVADAARAAAQDYKTYALSEQTSQIIPANIRKFWRNVRVPNKPKVAFKNIAVNALDRLANVSVMLEYVGRDLETFRGVIGSGGGLRADQALLGIQGLPPIAPVNAAWQQAVHRVLSAGPDFIAQDNVPQPGNAPVGLEGFPAGSVPQTLQIGSALENPNNLFDVYAQAPPAIFQTGLVRLGERAEASGKSIMSLFLQEELLSLGYQPTLITTITATNEITMMVENGEVNPFLAQ